MFWGGGETDSTWWVAYLPVRDLATDPGATIFSVYGPGTTQPREYN
jgi:hypothetical protein